MKYGTEPELVRLVTEEARNGTRDWVQFNLVLIKKWSDGHTKRGYTISYMGAYTNIW